MIDTVDFVHCDKSGGQFFWTAEFVISGLLLDVGSWLRALVSYFAHVPYHIVFHLAQRDPQFNKDWDFRVGCCLACQDTLLDGASCLFPRRSLEDLHIICEPTKTSKANHHHEQFFQLRRQSSAQKRTVHPLWQSNAYSCQENAFVAQIHSAHRYR